MQNIKKIFISITFALAIFGSLVLASPSPVYAQDVPAATCNNRFLTFPAWYRGLPQEADCSVKIVSGSNAVSDTIWIIGLNLVEIIIQLVGYVCIIYIIIGGWKYLLSNGSPDANAKGKKTILNAVIGLIIASASVAVVNTIVGSIG